MLLTSLLIFSESSLEPQCRWRTFWMWWVLWDSKECFNCLIFALVRTLFISLKNICIFFSFSARLSISLFLNHSITWIPTAAPPDHQIPYFHQSPPRAITPSCTAYDKDHSTTRGIELQGWTMKLTLRESGVWPQGQEEARRFPKTSSPSPPLQISLAGLMKKHNKVQHLWIYSSPICLGSLRKC